MKKVIICIVFFFSLSVCLKSQTINNKTKHTESINLLPLYGGVEKTQAQKDSDESFLKRCDSQYSSRQEAAIVHVKMAWKYAYDNDRDTATKRFNQAWLLDSLNADVYWGLGIIQGSKALYDEAHKLFEKSVELNPNNENVWYCLAANNKAQSNKENEEHKKKRIEYLNKALAINSNFYPAIQMWQQEQKE